MLDGNSTQIVAFTGFLFILLISIGIEIVIWEFVIKVVILVKIMDIFSVTKNAFKSYL